VLGPDEQRLLEASIAYVAGNPIMTNTEFDELKLMLKVSSYDLEFIMLQWKCYVLFLEMDAQIAM
jgi:hypothetical protein